MAERLTSLTNPENLSPSTEKLPLTEAQKLLRKRIRATLRDSQEALDWQDVYLEVSVDGLGEVRPDRQVQIELFLMEKDEEAIKDSAGRYRLTESMDAVTQADLRQAIQTKKATAKRLQAAFYDESDDGQSTPEARRLKSGKANRTSAWRPLQSTTKARRQLTGKLSLSSQILKQEWWPAAKLMTAF